MKRNVLLSILFVLALLTTASGTITLTDIVTTGGMSFKEGMETAQSNFTAIETAINTQGIGIDGTLSPVLRIFRFAAVGVDANTVNLYLYDEWNGGITDITIDPCDLGATSTSGAFLLNADGSEITINASVALSDISSMFLAPISITAYSQNSGGVVDARAVKAGTTNLTITLTDSSNTAVDTTVAARQIAATITVLTCPTP